MNNQKLNLEPTILVIFGITGDLAKRYLFPSLYHIIKTNLLHEKTEIIGITRGDMELSELLSSVELCVREKDGVCDPEVVKRLESHLSLRHMDVSDPKAYDELLTDLNAIEDKNDTHMNRLYYLSIPPSAALPIINMLGEHGLNGSCQHDVAKTRLLAEKPFGYSLASAQELIEATAKSFKEEQIFRIDHYLAKETVENILAFRFNNPIFEPLWNTQYIDFVEVLANEKLGIEGRVNFYEQTGALRDLLQSHLMQILAIITMDEPDILESEEIHEKKQAIMRKMLAVPYEAIGANSLRGQYETYKTEVNNPDSLVETYAAIRIYVDTNRWRNVPLIVRTGKSLSEKKSEVNIVFKPTDESRHHNILTFKIQPNEGIKLSLRIKKPGFDDEVQPVEMSFDYESSFSKENTPTAYERVLVDAVRGDHTLFATSDEILESWRVVEPVQAAWNNDSVTMEIYPNESKGPDISRFYPDDKKSPYA